MRGRLLAVVVTLAGALLLTSPARAAINQPVAIWQMNESAGARTMLDSSGNGINGVIGTDVLAGTALSGAPATGSPSCSPTSRPPTPSAWSRWHTGRR